MKTLRLLFPLLLLVACTSQPTDSRPAPTASPSQAPTPTPTALPSASLTPETTIQAILTSPLLNLKVNEEMLLIGDVQLSNGQRVSLDALLSQIELQNLNPDLLQLEPSTRLLKALKAGTATIVIKARAAASISSRVTIQIDNPTPGIDPNVALVDVEIY
ncbi:MAG: hypothetical protein ACO1RX_21550 [Candidatus Sericytochromatia bacterium]